jgi:hypothetical protein
MASRTVLEFWNIALCSGYGSQAICDIVPEKIYSLERVATSFAPQPFGVSIMAFYSSASL